MRAVVIAIKNGKAAVAGENGLMCYIKDDSYQVGQILEVDDGLMGNRSVSHNENAVRFGNRIAHFAVRNSSGLAAALCLALATGGICAYAAPVKTVTDSRTPEIEYSLNILGRVIAVTSDEAEEADIADSIYKEVQGKKVNDAMEIAEKIIREEESANPKEPSEESDAIGLPKPDDEKPDEIIPDNTGMSPSEESPYKEPPKEPVAEESKPEQNDPDKEQPEGRTDERPYQEQPSMEHNDTGEKPAMPSEEAGGRNDQDRAESNPNMGGEQQNDMPLPPDGRPDLESTPPDSNSLPQDSQTSPPDREPPSQQDTGSDPPPQHTPPH